MNLLSVALVALTLFAGQAAPAILIPKDAVLDNEGEKIVYVLLSGETFQRRTVTLGPEYGDRVAVVTGVATGEELIRSGPMTPERAELEGVEVDFGEN